MKGIICKVWNIKGNTSANKKTTAAQVKDSISYILNDEKTHSALIMTGSPINDPAAQIERECQYIENDIKTVNGALVGVNNLKSSDITTAVSEMIDVKKFYGKLDGRAALHGVISIDSSLHTSDDASKLLQLCHDVMDEVFPDHQSIFAVHTNTDNLHVHFIVNSVGLNGKKIHQDKNFVKQVLQPCVNKYAEKYGFPINEEWKKKYENPTMSFSNLKIKYRSCIDEAIEESDSFEDFLKCLNDKGISANLGKYLSLRFKNQKKAIRSGRLGYNYSVDMIVERIRTKKDPLTTTAVSDLISEHSVDELEHQPYRKMKRYADMSPDEKRHAVDMLRRGLNPWKIHSKQHWQLNNFIDQENQERNVAAYINNYAPGGKLSDVKIELLRIRSILKKEKKELRLQKVKYKPIIDIYTEMKDIEKKAYLYEHDGRTEFKNEHDRYLFLTKKLSVIYDKDIYDVASFLSDFNDKYEYISGQLDEVYRQYAEVNALSKNPKYDSIETDTLRGFIGYDDAIADAKTGILSSDISYITSRNSEYVVKIEQFADINSKGKAVLNFKMTVLDSNGKEIDSVESIDNGYEFAKKMNEYGSQYGFDGDMKKSDSFNKAVYFTKKNNQNYNKTESDVNMIQGISFIKAVNHNTTESGAVHYIANFSEPEKGYFRVTVEKNYIRLEYFDKNNNMVLERNVPGYNNRTFDGWKTLNELSEMFRYEGNNSICFDKKADYDAYVEDRNRQKQTEENSKKVNERHI